jgi:uncharacterized coiled-coil DUF342 family protein
VWVSAKSRFFKHFGFGPLVALEVRRRLSKMKNTKARNAGFLVAALALLGLLGAVPSASAQNRNRRDVLTNSSYDRMRQWARELDQVAQRANRQAQSQQAGYRGFRRDSNFLRSIDHFARRADQFDAKMTDYRTRPWNVDEEIQHLLRDARTVQTRISRARFVDTRTRRDWDRVISLLSQMSTEYRAAAGGDYGRYRADRYPNGRYPDDRDRYPDARYPDDSGYGASGDLRQLAHELEQRAARISDLTSRSGYGRYDDDGAEEIREFREEARDFRNRVDSNRMSRSEVRSRVNRLLEDAREAYDEIRENRYSGEVVREWESIVNVLNRMRDLA